MSSGFVSGGTTDNPVQRDDEWLKAQQEIEANRRQKEDAIRQQDGKTLYEVLQNNKAAKQEAFEESIKLKNQFRNLDEDEIEFLDAVLESTRKKEEDVKRETTEQLDVFRRQQEEADKLLLEEGGDTQFTKPEVKTGIPDVGESQWALNARKRKRAKEKESLKGVKLRKTSSTKDWPSDLAKDMDEPQGSNIAASPPAGAGKHKEIKVNSKVQVQSTAAIEAPAVPNVANEPKQFVTVAGLGLAGYSSDEED